jgi:hypothetical protein
MDSQKNDITRLKELLTAKGYSLTDNEIEAIWNEHSSKFQSKWAYLPQKDCDLERIVKPYLEKLLSERIEIVNEIGESSYSHLRALEEKGIIRIVYFRLGQEKET